MNKLGNQFSFLVWAIGFLSIFVNSLCADARLPIIATTGQSNTFHPPRNYAPYCDFELNIPFGIAKGKDDGAKGELEYFIDIREAVRSEKEIGFAWELAFLLNQKSDFGGTGLPRFAVLSTGKEGRLASEWGGKGIRTKEFLEGLSSLKIRLKKEFPNRTPYLHAVVLNHGEQNAVQKDPPKASWDDYWSQFVREIRKSEDDVQVYIQTLNNIGLMPLSQKHAEGFKRVRAAQARLALDENCLIFDTNSLGGQENTEKFVRDNKIHYSLLGLRELASGTYFQFLKENKL